MGVLRTRISRILEGFKDWVVVWGFCVDGVVGHPPASRCARNDRACLVVTPMGFLLGAHLGLLRRRLGGFGAIQVGMVRLGGCRNMRR